MSLKSEFICNICKEILENPILLPCGCAICAEHLKAETVNIETINCLTCNQNFDIPTNRFPVIKIIKSLLEKELYLSDEERVLKRSVQESINLSEKLQDELNSKQANIGIINFTHFSELRRQIDIHREAFKMQIDEIALKMIDQTKKKEEIYASKIMEKSNVDIQICNKLKKNPQTFN